jgi:hypothetical protein
MSAQSRRVGPVKPLSVRLPEDLAALLRTEAERQDVGITELLREGALLRVAFAAAATAGAVDARALLAELERIGRQLGAGG